LNTPRRIKRGEKGCYSWDIGKGWEREKRGKGGGFSMKLLPRKRRRYDNALPYPTIALLQEFPLNLPSKPIYTHTDI
jgi:hypothetical protein